MSPKNVLITGGTSGIGREIASHFRKRDWIVTVQYHSSESRAKLLEKNNILTIQSDLSTPEGCEDLLETYRDHHDELHALVNNAAMFSSANKPSFDPENWNTQMALNARAPYHLSLECSETLLVEGSSIVNLTDCSIQRPYPGHGSYFASKAALENATLSLAKELAPQVRVNAVAPGPIDFPEEYSTSQEDEILNRTLLERSGKYEEVARAVWYLTTGATYTTGTTLEVDGGQHLS